MKWKAMVAQLANRVNQPHVIDTYMRQVYHAGICEGYKRGSRAALSRQWVSVTDRLPENDGFVLVYIPPIFPGLDRYEVARYDGKDWLTADGKHIIPSRWLPIPQFDTESPAK